jgi:hypothetical protein
MYFCFATGSAIAWSCFLGAAADYGYVRKKRERAFSLAEVDGEQNQVQLSHEELALLLGGIDLRETQRRRWYRKEIAEEPAA